jgi:hypothetical protein
MTMAKQTESLYTVRGIDRDTASPVSIALRTSSAAEAADMAMSRGVVAKTIDSEWGVRFVFRGNTWQQPGARPQSSPLPALILVSVLIPFIGFIAGAVMLGTGKRDGVVPILFALMGLFVWSVLIAVARA